jgi:hypothetical protein
MTHLCRRSAILGGEDSGEGKEHSIHKLVIHDHETCVQQIDSEHDRP